MTELFDKSGYREHRKDIREEDLLAYVREHPETTETWMRWSEDQRSSPNWCFLDDTTLGYIDTTGKCVRRTDYSDAPSACAAYIRKAMETMTASPYSRHE